MLFKEFAMVSSNIFLSIDFITLYKLYNWGNDSWQSDFKDILKIESIFSKQLSNLYISKDIILEIVNWGKLRNSKRFKCPDKINLTYK